MLAKLALIAIVALPPQGPAGAGGAGESGAGEPEPVVLSEGLWPSRKLMDSLLSRWADGVTAGYELDDAERAQVRKAVVDRWGRFFEDNRSTIQPLANEFLELRLGPEPPAKEAVQAWAERAGPVLEQMSEQFATGANDFRSVLDPLQKARFELEVLQYGIGTQVAQEKLRSWQRGDFEPSEFWEPPRMDRRTRRAEPQKRLARAAEETRKPPAETSETDQIARELETWEQYVEQFITLYNLDEGQRDAARSFLSELKDRALAHRDRRREEIARLERRIQDNTGLEEELAGIKKQLVELYGPIDEMFRELKGRIEQIPTAAQRADVARRNQPREPAESGSKARE